MYDSCRPEADVDGKANSGARWLSMCVGTGRSLVIRSPAMNSNYLDEDELGHLAQWVAVAFPRTTIDLRIAPA